METSGPFTTGVTWDLPDGTSARWTSRAARRRGLVELHSASGEPVATVAASPASARRLARANLVASVSFVLGGLLFAIGAVVAQLDLADTRTVDLVFLVGGMFFSTGGYVSVVQAASTPTTIDESAALTTGRWRWWSFEPRQIGWSSAAVLFVGTLFFAISLVAAFASDLTPRQSDGWIWLPDILGCVCFLVSGHLALVEVGHGRIWRVVDDLGWWVVAVNQLGSILFLLAGLFAFTRPATDQELDVALVNWGTAAGALCFAVAGVLQVFERPPHAPDERA